MKMTLVVISLLAIMAAAVLGLLVATRVPPDSRATVLHDASLPRQDGAGVTLHGRIVGAAEAPLVIVLHGGPGSDHRSLLALEALTDRHRVLFYDQRGAGLSERVSPESLGIAQHLADLDRLIGDNSPEAPVTLLGHSMGATLAVAYLGHAGHRVARAVVIEPGFLDAAGHAAFETRRLRLTRSPRVIWAGVLAGFRARHLTGDTDAAHDSIVGAAVHAFANHPRNPYHCGGGYTAPSWRFGGVASDTFWADVGPTLRAAEVGQSFAGPVLFLAGACNTWIGPALQNTHAARFANARVESIAQTGHDVVWDNPKASLTNIRAFLGSKGIN